MCSRGPATSVRPGETTRSVELPSSCQETQRSFSGPRVPEDTTATVSAPLSRTALTIESTSPSNATSASARASMVRMSATASDGTQAPTTRRPACTSRRSTAVNLPMASASPTSSTDFIARPRARWACSHLRAA